MKKILAVLFILALIMTAGCVQQAENIDADKASPEMEAAIIDLSTDIVNETETIDIGDVI